MATTLWLLPHKALALRGRAVYLVSCSECSTTLQSTCAQTCNSNSAWNACKVKKRATLLFSEQCVAV
eukprot:3833415-Amphidinium_carterae.1